MKIIAQRTGIPTLVMIDVGNGKARVVDVKRKQIFPSGDQRQLLKSGPWDAFSGDQATIDIVMLLAGGQQRP